MLYLHFLAGDDAFDILHMCNVERSVEKQLSLVSYLVLVYLATNSVLKDPH